MKTSKSTASELNVKIKSKKEKLTYLQEYKTELKQIISDILEDESKYEWLKKGVKNLLKTETKIQSKTKELESLYIALDKKAPVKEEKATPKNSSSTTKKSPVAPKNDVKATKEKSEKLTKE